MPVAPLATLAGAWLVRRMRPEIFYPFTYCTVALIAVKLIYDGALDVLALTAADRGLSVDIAARTS